MSNADITNRKLERTPVNITNEFFYKILGCCVAAYTVTRADIKIQTGISEFDTCIATLVESGLIQNANGNKDSFQITASGMSAFLNIQSQKQSARLANRAMYFAIASVCIAAIALILNIVK